MTQFVREEGEEDTWDAVGERESAVRSTVWAEGWAEVAGEWQWHFLIQIY